MQPKQPIRRDVPYHSLPKALQNAEILLQKGKRGWIAAGTAITHLGHSSKSSHGERTLGTLPKYGLLDSEGATTSAGSSSAIRPSRFSSTGARCHPSGTRTLANVRWRRPRSACSGTAMVLACRTMPRCATTWRCKKGSRGRRSAPPPQLQGDCRLRPARRARQARRWRRGGRGRVARVPKAEVPGPVAEAAIIPPVPGPGSPGITAKAAVFYLSIDPSGTIEHRLAGEWSEPKANVLLSLAAMAAQARGPAGGPGVDPRPSGPAT